MRFVITLKNLYKKIQKIIYLIRKTWYYKYNILYREIGVN